MQSPPQFIVADDGKAYGITDDRSPDDLRRQYALFRRFACHPIPKLAKWLVNYAGCIPAETMARMHEDKMSTKETVIQTMREVGDAIGKAANALEIARATLRHAAAALAGDSEASEPATDADAGDKPESVPTAPAEPKTGKERTTAEAIAEADRILADMVDRWDGRCANPEYIITRITKAREALADRPPSPDYRNTTEAICRPGKRRPESKWWDLDEYHEDFGSCLFARFDSGGWPESIYFGSPLDSDWPDGEFTHFTQLPDTKAPTTKE